MQFEDFEYSYIDSGIKFDKYIGSATSVNIPSRIYNLPITSIDNSAFAGCSSLESITLPDAWSNEYIASIFGEKPSLKIFRTSREKIIGKLAEYKKASIHGGEISVLESALNSEKINDEIITDIVAPTVNDLENLAALQKREDYFGRVINLINAVSSVELSGASDCLQKLNQEKTCMESDLKTNIIALLMLESKLFKEYVLPNPDLTVVKEAAQVLSKLHITF